ncbi:hypothetical protein LSAT2_004253 [Lamellibrachia satsuma]|nr:hypothetical protein LSAT2_004253 [Lamellibrachia satsuma]
MSEVPPARPSAVLCLRATAGRSALLVSIGREYTHNTHTSRDERRRWQFLCCCIHRNSSSVVLGTKSALKHNIFYKCTSVLYLIRWGSDAKNTSKKLDCRREVSADVA